MTEERVQLLPGVWLRAVQSEKYKTGCLSINLVRPLTTYEAPRAALVPSVLLRGTRLHPDIRSISHLLDELYGATVGTLVRKKGEILTTGFYADFIEDVFVSNEPVFVSVMAFLRELMFDPLLEDGVFAEEAVHGEKVNLINTIDARVNDKRSYATSQLLRKMCYEEAYGIPRLGEREEVETITAENLYQYWQCILAHSQIELFYLGRKAPKEVVLAAKNLFQGLPRGNLDAVQTVCVRRAKRTHYATEVLDVMQGKLMLGFRTDCIDTDPEYPALMLLNAVFGSGSTSKLFLNVREKRSLCYYASSMLEKHKGLMIVSSGIDFDSYEVTLKEILRQLNACREGDISEEELESARRSILSALRAGMDSPGRIDDYALSCVLSGCERTIPRLMEEIAALCKEDLVCAAQKITLDTVYFLKGEQV